MLNDFITTTHLSLIKVNGAQSASFLQGQLTCDIREITPTQSRFAAHCNAKGRVLASLRVINFHKQLYLLLPHSMVELTLKELGKYAPFSRVNLQATQEFAVIGCYGDKLAADLITLLGQLPQAPDQVITNDFLCIRIQADKPRFILLGDTTKINDMQQNLGRYTATAANENAWRLLDIQNSIANIYPATSDQFTPHMLNYPQLHAVSFTKGCYIGQEIIARTHYLGKVKRQLEFMTLATEQAFECGETLDFQGKTGIIIDSVVTKPLECQLLAVTQAT